MTGVCSSPALATCETNNVMLAGVSSGVENIFISLVAKEQMKNTCFHFTSKIKAISKSYQFSIPLFFVLGNLVFSYALGISRNILPKAISKVVETINFRKTKIFGNER